MRRTWGSETAQYPEEKKSTEILKVAASEIGKARYQINICRSGSVWKGMRYRVIAPYTKRQVLMITKSRAGHVLSCLNMGGPSSKAKYYLPTDSEQVP